MLGGLGAGIAYTFVRIAGKKGVKCPVIVAFFSGFSSLVTLPLMIMDFEPMTAAQLMFLILAGLAAPGTQKRRRPLQSAREAYVSSVRVLTRTDFVI